MAEITTKLVKDELSDYAWEKLVLRARVEELETENATLKAAQTESAKPSQGTPRPIRQGKQPALKAVNNTA